MNKNDLKKFVEQNPKLVTMKESTRYPGLFVLKYKNSVFYDNLWNDYLECCRGSVVDKDFNPVSLPFQKIYNYAIESRAPKFQSNEQVMAYDKINGFMCAVTTFNNEILVSTTGSLDSDYAKMAEEMINKQLDITAIKDACQDGLFTFLFECCHENDPHIIPEKTGMYLIGVRENDWNSTMMHMAREYQAKMLVDMAKYFNAFSVDYHKTTVRDLTEKMKTYQREGVVFYHEDGRVAKIKTKWYLIQKMLARKKDIMKLDMKIVNEEYYPLVQAAQQDVEFTTMDEQQRLEWCRNFLEKMYD